MALASQLVLPSLALASEPTLESSKPPTPKARRWTRHLFNRSLSERISSKDAESEMLLTDPPLAPAPGVALPWQPSFVVYGGAANLATGNLSLSHYVAGWKAVGFGISFSLVFNSQASATGTIGPKWGHSYAMAVSGTSPAVVTHPDGSAIAFTLGSGGYSAPPGIDETLTHNGNGTWTLGFKNGSSWSFDASGRLTSLQDANGNATTLLYTGSDLTSVKDASNRTLALAYTGGRLSSVTDFEGKTRTLGYDGSGRLTSVTEPPLNGQSYATTFGYGANNDVTSITNRLGSTWSYAYGSSDRFSTTTNPAGKTSGQAVQQATAPDVHDFNSAESASSTADANASTYPVDTVSQAYTEDASGSAKEYGMDASGRITAVRDGTGSQTNFGYSATNRLTQVIAQGGATTAYAYDARGNVLSVTDPTNRTASSVYDASNNVLTSQDGAGHTSSNTYDAHNNLLSTTDATSRTTSFSYNLNGTIASVTDALGKSTTYSYDGYGNRTSTIDPMGGTTTWIYQGDRPTFRSDPVGRTTAYNYDAWNRCTGVDYPQSADQTFTYDAAGRLTQTVDGTGTRTFTYNAQGDKIAQTDPRGNTTATYDDAGKITTQTDVSGRTLQYSYDGAGHLAQVSDPTSWASYTYDALGRTDTVTYSNGLKSVYAYDTAGRPVGLANRRVSNNSLVTNYTATYDAAGRTNSVAETVGGSTTSYGYDNAGRLLSENRTGPSPYQSSYTYDARGLRTTAFRSENGTTSHNGTYTYDDAGHPTSITDTVPGSSLAGTYVWNAAGSLTAMTVGGIERRFAYDEEARLTEVGQMVSGSYQAKQRYGYSSDGKRRWAKNIAANQWTWFPCGVACCAGELVEQTSDLSGGAWTTSSTSLAVGGQTIRRGNLILLPSLSGGGTFTTASGTVSSTEVLDSRSVVRSTPGSATTAQFAGNLTNVDGIADATLNSSGVLMLDGGNFATSAAMASIPWWLLPIAGCVAAKLLGGMSLKDAINACIGISPIDPTKPAPGPNPTAPGTPGQGPTQPTGPQQPPVTPQPPVPSKCDPGYHYEIIKCKSGSFEGCVSNGQHKECNDKGNPTQVLDPVRA